MQLSLRLNKIADKIDNTKVLADIGSDHAYIPIFLYKNKKIENAFACDISKGSIKKAQENILNKGLENNIKTRLGNGLLTLNRKDNVDTVIIAGMGGILINEILKNDILKGYKSILKNVNKLILQPQKNIYEVRKFLHKNNYKIDEDEIILDSGKFYTIIVAKKGSESINYTDTEYLLGKFSIQKKCPILRQYLIKQINKLESVISEIEKYSTKGKLEKINLEYELYKEVLKCL